jgi:hypothetical protein
MDESTRRAIVKFKLKQYTKLRCQNSNNVLRKELTTHIHKSVENANNYYNEKIASTLPRFAIQQALMLLDITRDVVCCHMKQGTYDGLSESETFSLMVVLRRNFKAIIRPIETRLCEENEPLIKENQLLIESPEDKTFAIWEDYYTRLSEEIKERISENRIDNISALYECFFKANS